MHKYPSAQEMVNIFPPWSKTRNDDQSAGYRLFNAQAGPMDRMDKELHTSRNNSYLISANLDEIDITHRVTLPTTFSFELSTLDPTDPCPLPPTVIGNPGVDNFSITLAEGNRLQDFWYKSVPNRFTLGRSQIIRNHNLITFTASSSPQTISINHHLRGGTIWIETTGGTEYLQVVKGELRRAKVIIRGITRKGTSESETLIFPWDMKQRTQRDWDLIEKIEVFDMQAGVTIEVRSADFNQSPYLDYYNMRYSQNRRKIDTFWELGTVGSRPTLDMVEYISDEWETLAVGLPGKQTVESWELLDDNDATITGVDLAVQPFTDRAWVTTNDGKLFLYDLMPDMVSGVDLLKERTPGSHVQLEHDGRYLVLDESFTFIPFHVRPLKEISSYRIWYQTPSGSKFGLLNGIAVSFSSNFIVKGQQLTRTIADEISVILNERGEYLFVLEATFIDEEIHTERVIVNTNFKRPLANLDISASVPYTISGIDFDSDQNLWVSTSGGYYEVNLHTDVMLIDYEQKLIYFKESYNDVNIITP